MWTFLKYNLSFFGLAFFLAVAMATALVELVLWLWDRFRPHMRRAAILTLAVLIHRLVLTSPEVSELVGAVATRLAQINYTDLLQHIPFIDISAYV